MNNNDRSIILNSIKTTIAVGYAVSLLVPYRVEKQNGETTYHAPLYKLAYKSSAPETEGETSDDTVHTYTITSFGLLNDQIATAKRLYTVAMLKKPYYKEKARRTVSGASDKIDHAITKAKSSARSSVDTAVCKITRAKDKVMSLEDRLCKFVEDIID